MKLMSRVFLVIPILMLPATVMAQAVPHEAGHVEADAQFGCQGT